MSHNCHFVHLQAMPKELKSMPSGSEFLGASAKSSSRRRTRTHVNTSAFEEDDEERTIVGGGWGCMEVDDDGDDGDDGDGGNDGDDSDDGDDGDDDDDGMMVDDDFIPFLSFPSPPMAAGGARRARSTWHRKRQVSPPPPPPGVPPPWRKGDNKRHVSQKEDVEVIDVEDEEEDAIFAHLSEEELEIPQYDIPNEVM